MEQGSGGWARSEQRSEADMAMNHNRLHKDNIFMLF